jgi:hypothetical protein
MFQPASRFHLAAFVLLATIAAACADDDLPNAPTPTPPVAVTETFEGTLTVNGAATYPFIVGQAGLTAAVLTTLSPDTATVGVSLGTWNGQACQVILANDSATQSVSVVGEARSAGNFCVRIHDVGKLTAPAAYLLTVTHF